MVFLQKQFTNQLYHIFQIADIFENIRKCTATFNNFKSL